MKVFGCLCFASIHDQDKLSPTSIPSVFFGYPHTQKGYKLYSLETKQVFVSRHVIFHEHLFPFCTSFSNLYSIPDSTQTSTNDPFWCSAVNPYSTISIFDKAPVVDFNSQLDPIPGPLGSAANTATVSKHHMSHYLTYDNLPTEHQLFMVYITPHSEPAFYHQAISNPYGLKQ